MLAIHGTRLMLVNSLNKRKKNSKGDYRNFQVSCYFSNIFLGFNFEMTSLFENQCIFGKCLEVHINYVKTKQKVSFIEVKCLDERK